MILKHYMDRITKTLLNDFLKTQEIIGKDESSNFEKFVNYSILSNEYNKSFDIDSISIGAGNDTGIDGLAIIVNGHLIEELNEIDDLLAQNGYLDVKYIFIQSKTSSTIDTSEMLQFYNGVYDFFSEEHKLIRNEDIKKLSEISDYIFTLASDFKQNPSCKIFYITTSTTVIEDANIQACVQVNKKHLDELNLFENIDFIINGANDLGKLYRKTKTPLSCTIQFPNKITLPETLGIDESYYGFLQFSEFKKLIIDQNDNIQNVFEDNVRDFQGLNAVNLKIEETLKSDNPHLFSVLNNGVTIVANEIKISGDKCTLFDFQIVNGCQTSNILYHNRILDTLSNVNIPIKLIVTTDDDIKSKITVSTNSQTAVKKEQLSAMTDFQKNLEHYYNATEGDAKLYYERRANQYNNDSNVVKKRIISVSNQIKSFSSIFRQDPHLVTTYFGQIAKEIGNKKSKLFESDHQFASYYLAGLIFYKLDTLFTSNEIDKKFKKVKFYIIMLYPLLASKEKFPPLNSHNKVEKYCNPIIETLIDDTLCKKVFKKAIHIIELSGAKIEDKEALKSKKMTEQILTALNKYRED